MALLQRYSFMQKRIQRSAWVTIRRKDVVFCLGNHEFAFQSHPEVLKWWSKWSHPNVHCLDVEGFYERDGYRFVGNVLWYDWSLNKCRQLMQGEIIDGWLDATIKDFDAMKENEKC